jgi:hypothetical protein
MSACDVRDHSNTAPDIACVHPGHLPISLVVQITKNLSSPSRKNIPLNPQAKSAA